MTATAPPEAVKVAFDVLREATGMTGRRERLEHLSSLRAGVLGAAEELAAAVDADFRGRPRAETMLAEVSLVLSNIDWTRRRLRRWMRPQSASLPFELQPSRARIERVPLGVVAILAPWNYPIQLALLPLIAALAAGNRVLLHPSEFTPRTTEVLARIIGSALPADRVRVVPGGAAVAEVLVSLPLDGIFYTGSAKTGRKVMAAAAEHLVPVTLELGGKSPVVVLSDADLGRTAASVMAGKLFSAGQTCVAPDYVLAPRGRLPELLAELKAATERLYPDPGAADYAAIARDADLDRLRRLVEGHEVVPLMEPPPLAPRFGACAVVDPDPGSPLMSEEIFGPILPLIPYDDPAEARDFINARPCPLALYVYGEDRRACETLIAETASGGAMINDCLLHVAAHSLPFGGAGESGMGAYHGEEGFRAFSRPRSIMVQSRYAPARFARPPYGRTAARHIRLLLR